MRILLAHNSLYYPSHGGGDRSNRLLMEALAARGHQVRAVARVERFGAHDYEKLLSDLAIRGVTAKTEDGGVVRFELNGVDVCTVAREPAIRAYFSGHIATFNPDVIVTSTDDPGQILFDLAIKAPRARVVYLVRATIAVPFGPDSSAPNAAKAEMLCHADGVVGVSQYVANYCREHGNLEAIHVPISLLEPGLGYPDLGRFDSPYVTFVNPCAVKGISIFLALADRMPHVRFAAVPTWGTNAEDSVELLKRQNVEVLPPVDNIDELLAQTRVLLVPSVWAEARSRIVVEAMSRSVPVISSDAGGLPEAHMGVEYVIPVKTIRHYKPLVDVNMVPVAEVPQQEIEPWQSALELLTGDRAHWEDVSRRSRDAALEYARNLTVEPFEEYLQLLLSRPKNSVPVAALSDDKRRLLALRLKQKAAARPANPWFPGLEDLPAGESVLICFPWAGAGTIAFREWSDALAAAAPVLPVRLPGRETRASEMPFSSMEALVSAAVRALEPVVRERRFVLFGHSMGAGIAYEIARVLKPSALIVSAARAPQFRTELPSSPDPTDDELLDAVLNLGGISSDLIGTPALLRSFLPMLHADTRLYRRYVWRPGPPLDIPILAYGGTEDPNLKSDDIAAWQAQTTAAFVRREFPGGHFYLQNPASGFLAQLASDVRSVLR